MNLIKITSLFFLFLFNVNSQNESFTYLDPNETVENRVKDLMSRMTLEEKVYQMNQFVGLEHMRQAEKDLTEEELLSNDAQGFYKGVFSDDVAEMTRRGEIGSFLHVLTPEESNLLQNLAEQSRLKIPLLIGIDAIHGNALVSGTTVYPSPITLASTWEDSFLETIGIQTAKEMRATGSQWTFTPNIDILRDPRWGRVGETFGEDHLLVGNLGAAMIKGFQQNDFTGTEKVIACAKHMIAGGESINGLNAAPMDVSIRTLREVHLKPYKKAIDAGVYSIMGAHNELNGVPCHMNSWLMTDLFRETWGFQGFFVSDWMDIERIETLHHVANNLKEASYLAVNAGMDMHMHGVKFPEAVIELVQEGTLPIQRVNEACEKILTAKFKLGLFENRTVDLKAIPKKIFTAEHQQVALETARKGIVLLKNKNLLPLNKIEDKKRILVTGPNANNQTILGDWHAEQPDENVSTIFEGIKALGSKKGYEVVYHNSGESIRKINSDDIDRTVKKVKGFDYVVLVVGDNSMRYKWRDKTAGENMGRAALDLPGKQLELVQSIEKTGIPIIIVLVNGRPISEPWLDKNIPAIIEAWEPGSLGGQAVSEIIFGDVNPSGKLPLTVARDVGQLRMIYNHKPSAYFHKYAIKKSTPLYPFGYGLSYTNFIYSKPILSRSSLDGNESVSVTVNVTNSGNYDGDEIVQMYVRDRVSSVTRPVKELKGYKRVFIRKGETKQVSFEITKDTLAFYDIEMDYCVEPGEFSIMTGSSSADKDLKLTTLTVNKRI
ncbi:MAG: glycoside hydrolase family 3 N-terminal domain-containing protein, partial [Flavobacteriaceae bacterium]